MILAAKMKHNIRYGIIIYTNIFYVFAIGNWMPFRISRNLALDINAPIEPNLTTVSEDNSTESATEKRSNPDEFWLLRNDNSTKDTSSIHSEETVVTEKRETTEPAKPIVLDDPEWAKEYEMNELLFMSRNNCNLEIKINEWEDRKLKVQYEKLKNKTFGQCRLNLSGKSGILLAVLVSNVQLNGKEFIDSPDEVLKIVIRSNHFDYTLKEYYGNEDYYPVMLTESNRVDLILLFNGTNSAGKRSGYNLEVFNYYQNENNLNPTLQHEGHSSYGNSTRNVDDIFITTAVP